MAPEHEESDDYDDEVETQTDKIEGGGKKKSGFAQKKINRAVDRQNAEAIAQFGPGVLSYFELIRQLQRTFCRISVLAFAMMAVYGSF